MNYIQNNTCKIYTIIIINTLSLEIVDIFYRTDQKKKVKKNIKINR